VIAGVWENMVGDGDGRRRKPPAAPPLTGGVNCQGLFGGGVFGGAVSLPEFLDQREVLALGGRSSLRVGGWDGSVGVHWLQGTCPAEKVLGLVGYLAEAFGGLEGVEKDWGRYTYDRGIELLPLGVWVFYDSTAERGRRMHGGRCVVAIPGSALDRLDAEALRDLVHELCYRFWFLGTRVDLCFDDYRRHVSVGVLEELAERGDFTGFQGWEVRRPHGRGGVVTGETIGFGRRGRDGSGRYVRVYDKMLESGGVENCIRWEVEFSKKRAELVVWRLAESVSIEVFAGVVGSLIGGSIDLVRREGVERHLDRLERYGWWRDIVGVLGSVRLRNVKRERRVEASREWVLRGVSATLAVIRAAVGDEEFAEWLEAVVDTGEGNMSAVHGRMVRDYWDGHGRPKVGGRRQVGYGA